MQVSIRSLLTLVTLLALWLAGALSGPPLSWMAAAVLGATLLMQVINLCVGSRRRRCFAIGVLIPAMTYLLLTMWVGEDEYGVQNGRLPSSRLYQSLATSRYSGKQMPLKDFADELRSVRDTMPMIHLGVALFLGMIGGYYATWVNHRDHPDAVCRGQQRVESDQAGSSNA